MLQGCGFVVAPIHVRCRNTGLEPPIHDGLSRDPTEAKDLAAVRSDVVETLAAKLDAFPRGEDVALPLWRVVFDPDELDGEERGAPMSDRTRP